MRKIPAPHLGHDVVVGGRKRPVSYARRLTYRQLRPKAPLSIPTATHYETAAMTALRKMFLNNELGDCVIAARGHRIGVLTANSDEPFTYTDAQILAEYQRIGGYKPGDPSTDQGCVMSDAADDGVTTGYADGSRDAGWIDVDASNRQEVFEAIYLFEGGDLGMELPDAWLGPQMAAPTWDIAGPPNPRNGHCVEVLDYDESQDLVFISTWGGVKGITTRALAMYGSKANNGELIVHINQDEMKKADAKAPNGFDWSALVGFFDGLGGTVPVPAGAPGSPVTLEQAQAWARAGVSAGPWLQWRGGAAELAAQGLAAKWPR